MSLYYILGLDKVDDIDDEDKNEEGELSQEKMKEILKDRCIVYLSCNGTFNPSEWRNLEEWEQQIIYEASILVKQENAAMIGMAAQSPEMAATIGQEFDPKSKLQLICDRHARKALARLHDPRSQIRSA